MTNELARTEDPEVDDRVEKLVWKYLGRRSARQIADLAGVSPETVLRVKRDLLESVDVLTIEEKRTRLLVELQDLADEARDRAQNISAEFFAGTINASVAAIKAILVELARMEKSDDSKIERLNNLRIQELFNLVSESVDVSVREIADEHGLDEDELFGVFNRALAEAAEKRDLT